MTGPADPRILNDAEVTFLQAQAALEQARGTAESLRQVRLLSQDLFWESIGVIDGARDLLDDLIKAVSS